MKLPKRKTQKMSKILYAASTASHIKAFHTSYIDALRSEGHTVMTMAAGEGVDFNIPFEKKLLTRGNGKCRKEIRAILEKECFDIIILNTSLAAFHIRLATASNARPRIVNIVHGYLFPEFAKGIKGGLRKLLLLSAERILSSKTDAIIVMNNEDMRIASVEKLTRGEVYFTRGMGVPTPVFKSEPGDMRRLTGCEEKFVMCFAGELSTRKNQSFLLLALAEIKKSISNAHLWLLGDGSYKDELIALAKELNVYDNVSFLGNRNDAIDFMRDADVYVSPSRSEGLPFNVVEALGCGATVVATAIKGHTDILNSGCGFLVEMDDIEELTKTVAEIAAGKLSVTKESISEGFKAFCYDGVFEETYGIIKEACEL